MQEQKELKLIIQPKVIDHLGIKMYQKPVDVVAEFIANSWDADSEYANIDITNNSISIEDIGVGMTFQQCQDYFLTVGRDRRKSTGKEFTEEKRRPILGRKGIGKFAGFGIAEKLIIKTTSKENGEKTTFEMNISSILEHDMRDETVKPISVVKYEEPNDNNKNSHGTVVTLEGISNMDFELDEFCSNLSKRFLLAQLYDDFDITVMGAVLPDSFSEEMEFVFPQDLNPEEKDKIPEICSIEKGWAIEKLKGNTIYWRIGFFENPIQDEELRGVSIFAKGKLAQKPFFFDLTGGISAQHGLEYMTGQIRMDFIDNKANDLIATERQRINLQTKLGKDIRNWGLERIKLLSGFWKKRRSDTRIKFLTDKISGFGTRLERLTTTERKTVESLLRKIASFPRLGQERFNEWCNDVLTSWETGRLRSLITEMSEEQELDEQKLLDYLSEAGILSALNIAESIKTKVVTIGELKQRVEAHQLENEVRNFIYNNPWLIHPKWESFRKERSVKKLMEDIGTKQLSHEGFDGRVDLALSSGSSLLLIEFMRPGLELDKDHLDRFNYYVMDINNAITNETGSKINKMESAFLIADRKKNDSLIGDRIQQLKKDNIFVMKWDTLIEQALSQWVEYLDILKERYKDDSRIQQL